MYQICKTIFFCAFMSLPMLLLAQKKASPFATFAPDSSIQRLFDPAAKIQWIKYFSGRLDDVSDVDLTLGFDGINCKGYLTYTRSHTRMRLEGTLNNNDLRLREFSANDETTGYLRGTYTQKRLDADWSNYNNTIGSRLETEEVNVSQVGSSHCGDNKWINRYVTSYLGGRYEVTLLKANNGQIYGSAWMQKDDKTYTFKGEIAENGDYTLQVKNADGTPNGQMTGTMRYLQNLEMMWNTAGGGKQFFNLNLKETMLVGCYEYADFVSSYDVIFPKTKCNNCNSNIEKQVATWFSGCKNSTKVLDQEQIPANRAHLRASGWTNVTLWTDELLCGMMTFGESWHEYPHGISFNFDLKAGKEITYADLFIKNFEAKNWFAGYLKKETPKLAQINEPGFKEWIEKEGFPLFTLQRDGIALSTPFDATFGQQTIIVPYSTLKPYLKKGSVIAGFVK